MMTLFFDKELQKSGGGPDSRKPIKNDALGMAHVGLRGGGSHGKAVAVIVTVVLAVAPGRINEGRKGLLVLRRLFSGAKQPRTDW